MISAPGEMWGPKRQPPSNGVKTPVPEILLASSSLHGERSRIYNETAGGLNDTTITVSSADKGKFTANSFLCLRAESSVDIVIDQILVEIWD